MIQKGQSTFLIKKMDKLAISAVLCSILALSFLTLVNPTLLRRVCLETETSNNRSMENSPFDQNLKILLQSLSSSTPVTGYNYTSIGDGSDQVYVQALCRGDIKAAVCQKCLENASQRITKCQTEEALIWYDICQIFYSSNDFFNILMDTTQEPDQNYQRGKVSQPKEFRKKLNELIDYLSDKAAYSSDTMFATGDIGYSSKGKIYGLVQCTRDISEMNCRSCLISALGDLDASKEGGIIFSLYCNVRFEVFRFYYPSNLTTYVPQVCKNFKTYKPESSYRSNLNVLLSSLSSYATRHNDFYYTTAGHHSTVFGLFLCRGDVTNLTCQDCVAHAAREIQMQCPTHKEAIIWYNECMLRYSDQPIAKILAETPIKFLPGSRYPSVLEHRDDDQFALSLASMVNALAVHAANSHEKRKKFAVEKQNISGSDSDKLYGLVQCTPDLSAANCRYLFTIGH